MKYSQCFSNVLQPFIVVVGYPEYAMMGRPGMVVRRGVNLPEPGHYLEGAEGGHVAAIAEHNQLVLTDILK